LHSAHRCVSFAVGACYWPFTAINKLKKWPDILHGLYCVVIASHRWQGYKVAASYLSTEHCCSDSSMSILCIENSDFVILLCPSTLSLCNPSSTHTSVCLFPWLSRLLSHAFLPLSLPLSLARLLWQRILRARVGKRSKKNGGRVYASAFLLLFPPRYVV